MGLKLNVYGVWKGGERLTGATEYGVYAALGPTLSPTEFKANRGEIELAAKCKLPSLVTRKALRRDLHGMVSSPDPIPGLLRAADEAGLDYVGKDSRVFEGAFSRQTTVRKAKTRGGPSGLPLVEAEVDTTGTFALSPDMTAHCNLVITAVRNRFDLIRAEPTQRLIRAISGSRVRMRSHTKGRRMGTRGPFDMNMEGLSPAAASARKAIALSADLTRRNLKGRYARLATPAGALIALTAEAGRLAGFERLDLAIRQSRRVGPRPVDIASKKTVGERTAWLKTAPAQAMETETAHAG